MVGCSKGLRSVAAEYGIKDSATTFIQASNQSTHELLSHPSSLPTIRSLTGKAVSSITILSSSDPAPTGCAVYTLGSSATVFLDIKGRVDIDKEIAKAKDRLKKANEVVKKQQKVLSEEGFEEKVPDVVKDLEKERLRSAEAESKNWEMSMQQFERLKISG